jgi:hypothetical protein
VGEILTNAATGQVGLRDLRVSKGANPKALQLLKSFGQKIPARPADQDTGRRLCALEGIGHVLDIKPRWNFGFLERRSWGKGTLHYRLSEVGLQRLRWLRSDQR